MVRKIPSPIEWNMEWMRVQMIQQEIIRQEWYDLDSISHTKNKRSVSLIFLNLPFLLFPFHGQTIFHSCTYKFRVNRCERSVSINISVESRENFSCREILPCKHYFYFCIPGLIWDDSCIWISWAHTSESSRIREKCKRKTLDIFCIFSNTECDVVSCALDKKISIVLRSIFYAFDNTCADISKWEIWSFLHSPDDRNRNEKCENCRKNDWIFLRLSVACEEVFHRRFIFW